MLHTWSGVSAPVGRPVDATPPPVRYVNPTAIALIASPTRVNYFERIELHVSFPFPLRAAGLSDSRTHRRARRQTDGQGRRRRWRLSGPTLKKKGGGALMLQRQRHASLAAYRVVFLSTRMPVLTQWTLKQGRLQRALRAGNETCGPAPGGPPAHCTAAGRNAQRIGCRPIIRFGRARARAASR